MEESESTVEQKPATKDPLPDEKQAQASNVSSVTTNQVEISQTTDVKKQPEQTEEELEQEKLNGLLAGDPYPEDSKNDLKALLEQNNQNGDNKTDENKEIKTEEETDDEDDDEDDEEEEDEEDEVTITINEVVTPPSSFPYAPVNLNITKRSAAFAPSGQVTATAGSNVAKAKPGFDIDAPGQYNGQSIYDVNLDSLDDKPWRKPGADITDYFNYGFTEETWKIYCERQKRLRGENGLDTELGDRIERTERDRALRNDRERPVSNALQRDNSGGNNIVLRTFVSNHREREREHSLSNSSSSVSTGNGHFNNTTGKNEIGNITGPSINENSKYAAGAVGVKKAGPPPGRKICGAIEVIGAGAQAVPSVPSPITTTNNSVPMQNQGPHVMRRQEMKDSNTYIHGIPTAQPTGAYGAPPSSFAIEYQNTGPDIHSMGYQTNVPGQDYMTNRFDMNQGPPMENQFDNDPNMYRDDSDERTRDFGFSRNMPNSGRGHMNRDYGREDNNYRNRTGASGGYRNDNYDKDRSRDKDRESSRRRERERSDRDRDREKRRKV